MFLEFVRKLLGMLSSSGSTTSSTVVSNEESGSPPIAEEATPPIVEDSVNLSQKGLDWLKKVERLALKPYDDQTGKQITSWVPGATIGYGHLIAKGEWNKFKNGISEVDATALLWSDLASFIAVVKEIKRPLAQHQFDACVILAFNIGVEGFRGSTVRKMVANPNFKSSVYKNLEAAWKAWNKSQGKINRGVVNRRDAEWDMYEKGIYRHW